MSFVALWNIIQILQNFKRKVYIVFLYWFFSSSFGEVIFAKSFVRSSCCWETYLDNSNSQKQAFHSTREPAWGHSITIQLNRGRECQLRSIFLFLPPHSISLLDVASLSPLSERWLPPPPPPPLSPEPPSVIACFQDVTF